MKTRKEKRKYVARPGIEPRTPDLRVRCPTDCATRPGIFCWNKSAEGIAWCPATALTSSEVTVLNLCTSSSHALYCTKFWEIIWNDIKVIEWTWFLYWKFQREIILQKDTISILTIYKITKWHKTEKNCRKSNSSQSKSGHTLFVPSFVKWSQTVSKL